MRHCGRCQQQLDSLTLAHRNVPMNPLCIRWDQEDMEFRKLLYQFAAGVEDDDE